MATFDRAGAKAAGYSDEEINSYLASQQPQAPAAAPKPSVAGFVGNAFGDLAGTVFGIPKLAANLVTNPVQTGQNIGSGLVNEYNDLLGRPFQNGKIIDLGEAAQHLYQHPVGSVLDILPGVGALGKLAKGGELADAAKVGEAADVAKVSKAAKALETSSPERDALTSARQKLLNSAESDNSPVTTYGEANGNKLVLNKETGNLNKVAGKTSVTPKYALDESLMNKNPLSAPLPEVTPNVTPKLASPASPELPPLAKSVRSVANKVVETVEGPGSKKYLKGSLYQETPIDQGLVRNKWNIVGSPSEQTLRASEAALQVGGKLAKTYDASNFTIKASELSDKVGSALEDITRGNPAQKQIINDASKAIKSQGEGTFSASTVWKLAQKLEQSNVPEVQQAGKIVRGILADGVKEARPLSTEYGALKDIYDNIPESNGTNVNGIGSLVKGVIGSAENAVGKVANKAYNVAGDIKPSTGQMPSITDRILNPVQGANLDIAAGIPKTLGKAGFTAAKSQLGQVSRFNNQGAIAASNAAPIAGDQGLPSIGGGSSNDYSTDQIGSQNPYPIENMQADIQKDPNHASYYQNLYAQYQKLYPSFNNLSSDQQGKVTNALSGLKNLDEVEKAIKLDPLILTKAALPTSPGARTFATARNEVADIITRLRTGSQLNADEVKFYKNQLPQFGDSSDTIAYKIGLFRDLFNNTLQNLGTGTNDTSSTLPAIGQ